MTLRDSLAQVQELVAGMTPGALTVYDANEGDGWPPRPLWCFKNDAYDSGDEPALQGSIHYGGKEDADAIVAAVNFIREHGPALLRDAGDAARYRWLRAEHAVNSPLAHVCWKRNDNRQCGDWVNTASPDSLDAAIDAARADERGYTTAQRLADEAEFASGVAPSIKPESR